MSLPVDDIRPSATSPVASERYAQDRKAVEDFARTFFVPALGPSIIAAQVMLRNLVPQLTATALLLGYMQKKPWALLTVPPNYFVQRMVSHYLVSSLSSGMQIDAAIHKVDLYVEQNTKQDNAESLKEEAGLIKQILLEIKAYHQDTDKVFSLLHQFLHA